MANDLPRFDRKEQVSIRGCAACLVLCLLVVGAATTLILLQCHPRGRVEISVKNIPDGTRFLCLAAESDDGLKLMDWSPQMIVPFRMPPRDCIMSYGSSDDRAPMTGRHVMWEFGDRYGIVTARGNDDWWITWFPAEKLPLEGRGLILGGGTVDVDLAQGTTEKLQPDLLARVGLQDLHWRDEKP
jgi:hypothetical protein